MYPEKKAETVKETYNTLRIILGPQIGQKLPEIDATEKLFMNMFPEEEALIIVNGFKKSLRPVTFRSIMKHTHYSKDFLKNKLTDMIYKGKILKYGIFYIVQQYLSGGFESYFNHNRDDKERMTKVAEAHQELQRLGNIMDTKLKYPLWRIFPAVEAKIKTIDVEHHLPDKLRIFPYEVIRKYMKKLKYFAVQPCGCRNAAKLTGNPCKRTDENFCISTGMLAKHLSKAGVAKRINLDELLIVLKKASENGLVHNTFNMQNPSMLFCNCCPCCCNVLKTVKGIPYKDGLAASNFKPYIKLTDCALCGKCIEICPMNAIDMIKSPSGNKINIRLNDCIGCGLCAVHCKEKTIVLKKIKNDKPVKGFIGFFNNIYKESKR